MRLRYTHPKHGTKEFQSPLRELVIGRSSANQLVDLDLSPDMNVSRRHARLTLEGEAWWLTDLDSAGGTQVNGQAIKEKTLLPPDASVQIGQTILTLLPDSVVGGTEAAPITVVEPVTAAPAEPLPTAEPSAPNAAESSTESIEPVGNLTHVVDVSVPLFTALGQELAQTQRQLRAFYELSQQLSGALTTEQLLQTLVQNVQQALPQAQRGAVLLWDEHDKPRLKAHWPQGSPSVSMTLAERARRQRQAFSWDAAETQAITPASVLYHQTQSAIYAPMVWQQEVLGVLYVDNQSAGVSFNAADVELLRAIANQAAMFIKNATLQRENAHAAEVMARLLRQFPRSVAEHLWEEHGRPQLGGKRASPVTILFSDVRGFTALGAKLQPNEVMQILNDMFHEFVPIVHGCHGMVDKYIGDAIMAVFGCPEPDDEQWPHAVRAAWQMREAVHAKLAARWHWVPQRDQINIGIGIHTGEVFHGFVGAKEHVEYTVIGDMVNRASRFCDGAGAGEVLISPEVYEHVFNLVTVTATTIPTKHEGHWPAYSVTSLRQV